MIITIRLVSIFPTPSLIVRVLILIHGSYISCIFASYWTTHILMALNLSQSTRQQYILQILSHYYLFVFGNQYITILMTLIWTLAVPKNLVTESVLKNMLEILLNLKLLMMTLRRSSLVLPFSHMSNPLNPNFYFILFMGSHTPSSNIYQIGGNKVSRVSLFILKHP